MQEFKEGLRQVLDPESIEALVDALDMDHSGSVPNRKDAETKRVTSYQTNLQQGTTMYRTSV